MTWLPRQAAGQSELNRVLSLSPSVSAAFRELYDVAWVQQPIHPRLAELCRLRMAQMLGARVDLQLRFAPARQAGCTEAHVAALGGYADSPLFDDRERACLELAEQFLVDARQISDELVERVKQYLSHRELLALVLLLGLFESFQRMCLVLDILDIQEIQSEDAGARDLPGLSAA